MFLNCGVGEDSWESLGQQGDKTSPSEENQSWIFIGRTDAEAEASILWPSDARIWPTGKYWLYGYEFEQALGVDVGQGSLACCSLRDCKESDSTEWLNRTDTY